MTEYETLSFWPNTNKRPYPKESPNGPYKHGCTYNEIIAMNKVLDKPISLKIDIDWRKAIGHAIEADRILNKLHAYQTKVQTEAYNNWLNQNFPK